MSTLAGLITWFDPQFGSSRGAFSFWVFTEQSDFVEMFPFFSWFTSCCVKTVSQNCDNAVTFLLLCLRPHPNKCYPADKSLTNCFFSVFVRNGNVVNIRNCVPHIKYCFNNVFAALIAVTAISINKFLGITPVLKNTYISLSTWCNSTEFFWTFCFIRRSFDLIRCHHKLEYKTHQVICWFTM